MTTTTTRAHGGGEAVGRAGEVGDDVGVDAPEVVEQRRPRAPERILRLQRRGDRRAPPPGAREQNPGPLPPPAGWFPRRGGELLAAPPPPARPGPRPRRGGR